MMTVSNVINGRDKFVGEKTRALVQKAIQDLNYRPNRSGQRLRNARSLSIGLVIMNNFPDFLSDPFISTLTSGLCNHLSDKGFSLEVQGVKPETFRNANAFCNSGNDAICVILCGEKQHRHAEIEFLKTLNQPIVVLQEDYISNDGNLAIVKQDDYGAGKLVAQHVLQKQPKSVLFIKSQTHWSAIEQREQAIIDVFRDASINTKISTLVTPSEMFEDALDLIQDTLQQKPVDCILAATDTLAMVALKACEHLDYKVPNDTAIAGFNGFEAWQYSTPLLTTIVSPAYELGLSAAEMMLAHIQDGQFPSKNKVFPVRLKIGGST